jgi:hypothetical protein
VDSELERAPSVGSIPNPYIQVLSEMTEMRG